MNKTLINNWNNVIKPNDIVYHLGDVSFKPNKFVDKLNGEIILIYGNHDKRCYNDLFHEVKQTHEMKIAEFKCLLTHVPLIDNGFYKKNRLPSLSLADKYQYIICGHVHENWKVNGKNINVGVDVWDMKPVHINELARFLRSLN
jgi:calcineurin-like phosphoesterase family protein